MGVECERKGRVNKDSKDLGENCGKSRCGMGNKKFGFGSVKFEKLIRHLGRVSGCQWDRQFRLAWRRFRLEI